MIKNTEEFVTRYMEQWNTPDATARRKIIEQLWASDAKDYIPTRDHVVTGWDAITERVRNTNEKWVQQGVLSL